MAVVDVELLISKLKGLIDLDAIQKEIDELKAQSFSNPLLWLKEASDIVKVVILSFGEVLTDLQYAADDEEARKALKDFIDDLIDLPFWAETLDDVAINWLVDFALDFLKEEAPAVP